MVEIEKYCIGIWKVEKIVEKKQNGMEWFGGLGKLEKMEWNGMVEMGYPNKW